MATLLTPRTYVEPVTRRPIEPGLLVGGVAWAAACFLPGIDWIDAFTLLAPLVLVPLALPLVRPARAAAPVVWLWEVTRRCVLPAALLWTIGLALDEGWLATLLTVPWLLVALLLTTVGTLRLLGRSRLALADVAQDVGLIYLSVAGAWAVIVPSGWRPVEFPEVILRLTIVHFHYAGLLLPIIVGLVLQRFSNLLVRAAAVGVLLGVPLLALGITLSPPVEIVAAVMLTIAAVIVAGSHMLLAVKAADALQRTLWLIAGTSLIAAILLAVLYAAGEFVGQTWIDIPTMVPTHGLLNAVGFTLPALLGWRRGL